MKTTNIRNRTEEDSSPLLRAEWSFLKPGTSIATNTPTRKPGPKKRARRRGLSLNIEDPKQQLLKSYWKHLQKKCMKEPDQATSNEKEKNSLGWRTCEDINVI